jgi:hypothetical protein
MITALLLKVLAGTLLLTVKAPTPKPMPTPVEIVKPVVDKPIK